MRAVARAYQVSLATVQWWVQRAAGQRLDRVDWTDRSHAPHRTRRTAAATEAHVLELRQQLRTVSALGEYGAAAIHRAWAMTRTPSISPRTIHRILERHGVLDAGHRVRRPPPPRGWHLPDVSAG